MTMRVRNRIPKAKARFTATHSTPSVRYRADEAAKIAEQSEEIDGSLQAKAVELQGINDATLSAHERFGVITDRIAKSSKDEDQLLSKLEKIQDGILASTAERLRAETERVKAEKDTSETKLALTTSIEALQKDLDEVTRVVADFRKYAEEHRDSREKFIAWKKGADKEMAKFDTEWKTIKLAQKQLKADQDEVMSARKYVEAYAERLGGHVSDAKHVIDEVNALLKAGRLPAKYELPPDIDYTVMKWKE